jgi:ATP synthase protein I
MVKPPDFATQIQKSTERRRRGKASAHRGLWFGLGAMGMVGWSVVVPSVAGAALGSWLDGQFPGTRPWTLTFLIFGLVIGCWTAGRWVAKQLEPPHD